VLTCSYCSAAGGEGATAREVLRHKSVEKVVMVDIDKVRTQLTRMLPGMGEPGGACSAATQWLLLVAGKPRLWLAMLCRQAPGNLEHSKLRA
jgi:hypothetical protein